jgi:hypothetical protein
MILRAMAFDFARYTKSASCWESEADIGYATNMLAKSQHRGMRCLVLAPLVLAKQHLHHHPRADLYAARNGIATASV